MTNLDASAKPNQSARARLTPEVIVDTAIALVDEDGLQALTMRRLGTRLGVEAMAIYHHFNGREDLLEGIVRRLVEDIRVPADSAIGPRDGWQGYMKALAHSVREVALAHPALFPLIASRPPAAPWLRPPLRSLAIVEDFLTALLQRGVSEDHAVEAYQLFTSFLLGHLFLEVAQQGSTVATAADVPLNEGGADSPTPDSQEDLDEYPTLSRLRLKLAHHEPEVEFEQALELHLDDLDRVISQ